MDASTAEIFKDFDPTELTPVVRKSLNREDAQMIDWKHEPLYGASSNARIYRFSGSARSGKDISTWSVVLKVIRSEDGTDDPASFDYWKREALAYESGLLEHLCDGLRAPRCFQAIERPGREMWLWLEEIVDRDQAAWSLEQYGKIAYQLGLFNGLYSQEGKLPAFPWLAKGWLRLWVSGSENNIPLPPEILAHPLVSRVYPPDIVQRMLRVWSERQDWLTFIERQPQTLAHMDAFRRNLFTQPDPPGEAKTILIDWAFLGKAAVGEEICPLVAASLNFLEIGPDQAEALDKIVFENYLKGLGEAGWQGDPRQVRFTYAASVVLRFSIGVAGVAFMVADENQHALLRQFFGHPVEELVEVWARTTRFFYSLADEARAIYSSL